MEAIRDFICVICQDLLIKPVITPCKHCFCLECLTYSCDVTSYNCPLCNKRNNIWWRRNRDKNNLVDENLWATIQRRFPDEVKKRNAGQCVIFDIDDIRHEISSPGEIGQELDKQHQEFVEEVQLQKEKEEKLSKALIKNILKEDQLMLATPRITRRLSQRFANVQKGPMDTFLNRSNTSPDIDVASKKLIQKILAEEKSLYSTRRQTAPPSKKRKKKNKVGPMDKLVVQKEKPEESFFRPIATCPTTPTKKLDSKPAISPVHVAPPVPKVLLEKFLPLFSENSAFDEIRNLTRLTSHIAEECQP